MLAKFALDFLFDLGLTSFAADRAIPARSMTLDNNHAPAAPEHSNTDLVKNSVAAATTSSASSSPSSVSSPASSPLSVVSSLAAPAAVAASAASTPVTGSNTLVDLAPLFGSTSSAFATDNILFSQPHPFASYHRKLAHPYFPPPPHLSHRSPSTPEDLAAIARSVHSPSSPSSVVSDFVPPRAPSPPAASMHAISPNGPSRHPARPPTMGLPQGMASRPPPSGTANTAAMSSTKPFASSNGPAKSALFGGDGISVSTSSSAPHTVSSFPSDADVFGPDITSTTTTTTTTTSNSNNNNNNNNGNGNGNGNNDNNSGLMPQLLQNAPARPVNSGRPATTWTSSQGRSVMDAIQEDFPRTPSLLQEDFPRLPGRQTNIGKNQERTDARDPHSTTASGTAAFHMTSSSPGISDDMAGISRIVATLDLNHPLDDVALPSSRRCSVNPSQGHRRSASINWTGDTAFFSDNVGPSLNADMPSDLNAPSVLGTASAASIHPQPTPPRPTSELTRSPSDMYITNFTAPSEPSSTIASSSRIPRAPSLGTLQMPIAQKQSSPSFAGNFPDTAPPRSIAATDGTHMSPYHHHFPQAAHSQRAQPLSQQHSFGQQQAGQSYPSLLNVHNLQTHRGGDAIHDAPKFDCLTSSAQPSTNMPTVMDDSATVPGTGNTYSLPMASYSSPFPGFGSSLQPVSIPQFDSSNAAVFRDGLTAADSLKTMSMQMCAFLNVQQQLYAAQMAQMAAITSGTASIANANAFAPSPAAVGSVGRAIGGNRAGKSVGDSSRSTPHGPRKGGTSAAHGVGRGNRRGARVQDDTLSDMSHSRSPLLEEFRATSAGAGGVTREWQLSDIKEHVIEFATDQHGSRFIQQRLEGASQEELDAVLHHALADAHRLITDVFGNYVVQKLLEHGGDNAVNAIAQNLEGRMLSLSLHMYGCRVVQKALEVVKPDKRAILVKELDGQVTKCIHDQNANHVIQKCIEVVEPESMQFIVDAVQNHAVVLASHSYGCRVVQRLLEHGSEEQKRPIMAEIMASIADLIKDTFANYVVQHVVEHGTLEERSFIIDFVRADVCNLSQHKFASNVVERCLQHGSASEREVLINILIGDNISVSPLNDLVRDSFGNYVVQRILDVAQPAQRERVVSILRLQVPVIKKYSYGKHIIARLGEDASVLTHQVPQHLITGQHGGLAAHHQPTYQQF